MRILTTICCAAVALCNAVFAQTLTDHMTVRFSAPVLVGETKIPAGACDIQVVRGSSNNTIIVFRSETGISAATVASRVSDTDASENTSVVLNRRGDDLRLYRIMFADHVGYELNPVE